MEKRKNKFYPNYFTFPAIIIFSIFFALPIIAGFVLSYTDLNMKRLYEPHFNGLKNFIYLFQDEYFLLALKNTFIFVIITTVLIVVLGLLLALVLNNAVKGKSFFRTLFYLPAVLSFIVIGIMFTSVFKMNNGVFNQFLTMLGLEGLVTDWLGNKTTAMGCIIFVQVWNCLLYTSCCCLTLLNLTVILISTAAAERIICRR